VEIPEPHELLADAERALKLVRAYYERAGDEASLFAAGAIRWRLVGLLGPIASALEAIAEWEPRDFDRYETLEKADIERLPDLYAGTAFSGREAFEHDREATSDLYVMANALRRAQILLNNPGRINLDALDLPQA
jgi:hypothetical protein